MSTAYIGDCKKWLFTGFRTATAASLLHTHQYKNQQDIPALAAVEIVGNKNEESEHILTSADRVSTLSLQVLKAKLWASCEPLVPWAHWKDTEGRRRITGKGDKDSGRRRNCIFYNKPLKKLRLFTMVGGMSRIWRGSNEQVNIYVILRKPEVGGKVVLVTDLRKTTSRQVHEGKSHH